MSINNPELYAMAKKIADETYEKPSAYKSGFIVKKYKELGGTYSDDGQPKNLKRWFKEDWKDVANLDYPVYRPTKRVSIKTPLTPAEIDPENLKEQSLLKQQYKGFRNLPPFKTYDDEIRRLQGGLMNAAKLAIARKIRNPTKEQVDDDFKSLEELPCDDNIQKSLAGLKVVDSATFPERLDVVGKTNRNYYDILKDKKELLQKRYIKNIYDYTKKKSPNINEEQIWFQIKNVYFNSVNAFKPSISKYLFCKFGAKNILDFSAGWGGRLVGAMALPDTKYIGIDTNTDLKRGYNYLIKELGVKDRVKMIWGDSAKVDYSKLKYDFVFTSPPYFTLEKYEGMPEYKTVEEFNEKFWFPVLKKVWAGLDKGGKMLLNVPKPMYEDTKKVLGAADKLVPLYKVKRGRVGKSKKEEYEEYIYLWSK